MLARPTYFDIHCHRKLADDAEDQVALVNYRAGRPTEQRDSTFFSIGIHPWDIDEELLEVQKSEVFLNASSNSFCLAVGETGLDTLCKTPMQLQEAIFEWHCQIAEFTGKPLIIHCVRAYEQVLRIKKRFEPESTWLIHGFRKNAKTAESLIKHGFQLSFGSALLSDDQALREAFYQTPIALLHLETDDSTIPISEVYRAASEIKGISVSALQMQMQTNWSNAFGIIF